MLLYLNERWSVRYYLMLASLVTMLHMLQYASLMRPGSAKHCYVKDQKILKFHSPKLKYKRLEQAVPLNKNSI